MKIAVAGAAGRMGRTLVRIVTETPGLELKGGLEAKGSPHIGADLGSLAGLGANGIEVSDDAERLLASVEGLLDFTTPGATAALVARSASAGIVHVIGTTGLTPDHEAAIRAAARKARIVKSGNMSLGVNLLAALVRKAAAALGEEFDIEIAEMHHRMKVDAPSGTALLLGAAAAQGRGLDLDKRSAKARDGLTGARHKGDIGFASLRGGSVVGDHAVIFAGDGERIELCHRAENRDIFARGAIRAALWAAERKPGLYSMADVLGVGE
jgi:4-hydroxy-tetrahydrodipicolinate reductase